MSVVGGPTLPTALLASDAAIAGTTVVNYDLPCLGFRRAIAHIICDQTWDYYMLGRLQGMTQPEQLYAADGAKVEKKQISGGTGVIVPVDIEGLDLFRVSIFNNVASAGTLTLSVTLVP